MSDPTPKSPGQHPPRIPSLDGIRCISALAVFVSHWALSSWGYGWLGPLGVTVFFFLSGFLITTLLRVEASRRGQIDIVAFYLRRTFRILPPAYFAIFLLLCTSQLGILEPLDLSWLPAGLLHLTNYWMLAHHTMDIRGGAGPFWSLAVEEHFYLVFPLGYAWLLRRRLRPRHQGMVFLAICVAVLLWRCVCVWFSVGAGIHLLVGTDARLDSILFGCALATLANPVLDRPVASDRVLGLVALPALLLLFGGSLVRGAGSAAWMFTLQGAALAVLFTCAIRLTRAWPVRFLNHPVVAFGGNLSFSFYLVHLPVQQAFSRLFSPGEPIVFVLSLPTATLIAYLMYRLVETPSLGMRKRLELRRVAANSSVAA